MFSEVIKTEFIRAVIYDWICESRKIAIIFMKCSKILLSGTSP
jgi:hypothetical protein